MKKRSALVSTQNVGMCILVIALGSAVRSVIAQEAKKTVWSGVYTEEQAGRGQRIYRRVCAKCHLSDLSGADIAGAVPGETPPALRGSAFLERWQGKTVGGIFSVIKGAMPLDAPGALAPELYIDVLSYLLKMNEFPSGMSDLAPDHDTLQILIAEKPASPQNQ